MLETLQFIQALRFILAVSCLLVQSCGRFRMILVLSFLTGVPVAATYQRGKSEAEEPHYINMDPKLMKQNEGRVGEACSTEAKSIDCCDEEVEEGEACQGVSNREDHGCALSSHVYVLDTEKRQVCSRPVGKVSSDTEDDYENVSKPSRNVSKNMYTDKDCIYENY